MSYLASVCVLGWDLVAFMVVVQASALQRATIENMLELDPLCSAPLKTKQGLGTGKLHCTSTQTALCDWFGWAVCSALGEALMVGPPWTRRKNPVFYGQQGYKYGEGAYTVGHGCRW